MVGSLKEEHPFCNRAACGTPEADKRGNMWGQNWLLVRASARLGFQRHSAWKP